MELTTYNPQKGRLETLEVEITEENTTWFEYSRSTSVSTITDFEGGILIKKNDYSYPVWLYDITRADINYSKKKAKELMQLHT
ncbi:MAG: hypothetical protein WC749_16055 [Dehalococcoidia bacterium]